MPNCSRRGSPSDMAPSASSTTAPSMQPPETEPTKAPSPSTTSWLPTGRGDEPQVSMTVALATVIETWGSSPRPVGSQHVVDGDGAFVGSVSGGCIEGAVVEEALGAISDGEPRLLQFGITDDQAWSVGLACG